MEKISVVYNYKVNDLKDEAAVLGELMKLNGVVSAYFEDGYLFYELEEQTDEYDILIAAMNLCEQNGGELIVGEEERASDYDYDAVYRDDAFGEPDPTENGEGLSNEFEKEPVKKPTLFDPEEESGDHIVAARKKLKTESIIRFIELAASLALYILAFFLPENPESALSFRNVSFILSFGISVYEILYSAIIDLFKKRFNGECVAISVACIIGAFSNKLWETALLTLIFAIAKEIRTYIVGLNALRIDEEFYTGSLPVNVEGRGSVKKTEIEVGDIIALRRYEIVPCDAVSKCSAVFDRHTVGGGVSEEAVEGETVLAGSLLLSESASLEAIASSEDSKIEKDKLAFREKIEDRLKKSNPKFLTVLSIALYIAAVSAIFIPPLFFKSGYSDGLLICAPIGALIAFIANVGYAVSSVFEIVSTAVILSKVNRVEYKDVAALEKTGRANSFVFSAKTLTENGAVKSDAIGALKELMSLGVRNVTTDFSDSDLKESVRKQIDFVDKSFVGEKKLFVKTGGDLSLDDSGSVSITSGEISYVPYAYKVAKRAVTAKKSAAGLTIAGYCLSLISAGLLIAFAPEYAVLAAAPVLLAGLLSSLVHLSVALTKP